MRKYSCLLMGLVLVGASSAFGQSPALAVAPSEAQPRVIETEAIASGTSVAVAAVLAHPEAALAASTIRTNLLKGNVGEAIVNRAFVEHMRMSGNWQALPSHVGPHGLDNVFVQYRNGEPSSLIVGETKYGTSQLATTAQGDIQASLNYCNERLQKLADLYDNLGGETKVGFASRWRFDGGEQTLDVTLKDGATRCFWRESPRAEKWYFNGTAEELSEARTASTRLGRFLRSNAEGVLIYKRYVYVVGPQGDSIHVVVYDAKDVQKLGTLDELPPVKREFQIGEVTIQQAKQMTEVELVKTIRKQYPHLSSGQAEEVARGIRTRYSLEEILNARFPSVPWAMVVPSVKAGVATAGIVVVADVALDLLSGHKVLPYEVAQDALVGFAFATSATYLGQAISIEITRTPLLNQFATKVASTLGIGSTSLTTNILGASGAAVVVGVGFAYGKALLGWESWGAAHREAIINTSAVGGGVAGAYATLAMVGAYGTASTGTAIASLSGAAATNASLAALGGGSVATGGGGMALGGLALTGVGIVAAVGVGGGAYLIIHYHDDYKERERVRLTLNALDIQKMFLPGQRMLEAMRKASTI